MICKKCGAFNEDGKQFCGNCGEFLPLAAPISQPQNMVPEGYTQPKQEAEKTPGLGLAIASMICGILSLLCLWYICGSLGIIFGAVAKNKGSRSGMATAGIVCGILGIALNVILIIFMGIGGGIYDLF